MADIKVKGPHLIELTVGVHVDEEGWVHMTLADWLKIVDLLNRISILGTAEECGPCSTMH